MAFSPHIQQVWIYCIAFSGVSVWGEGAFLLWEVCAAVLPPIFNIWKIFLPPKFDWPCLPFYPPPKKKKKKKKKKNPPRGLFALLKPFKLTSVNWGMPLVPHRGWWFLCYPQRAPHKTSRKTQNCLKPTCSCVLVYDAEQVLIPQENTRQPGVLCSTSLRCVRTRSSWMIANRGLVGFPYCYPLPVPLVSAAMIGWY